jgi:hypothetical protein
MNAVSPLPISIDPRPCGLCGLTIDRHQMVDQGEGPLFFCRDLEDLTLSELELRAELMRQIYVAEMVARWEAMDCPADACPPPKKPEPYRTPQATTDAFFYVVALDDVDRLKEWLDAHPKDAPTLLKLLEAKLC